jgi:hypothetical protein
VKEGARDYARFVEEVESLSDSLRLEVANLGRVGDYPLLCCRLQSGGARRRILISAGTHGDEPAGPAAALQFLRQCRGPHLQDFSFLVLPCINPHGYVHRTRENRDGRDINRSFAGEGTPESDLVRELLTGESFDLLLDLHEDWEHAGYYLWEGRPEGGTGIGSDIVRRIETIGPVYSGATLDGYPIAGGVISAAEAQRYYEREGVMSLLTYGLQGLTDHGITSETPTQWKLADRVRAQLDVLDVALEHYAV